MEHTRATSATPVAGGIEPARTKVDDAATVRALAQQFEAMLLSQMLRDMKDSMSPEADCGGLGAPILGDTINAELGLSLSRAGGVGLADALMKALDAYRTAGTDVETTEPSVAPVPEPIGAAGLMPPVGVTVTSDYGWRTDPITGKAKFHEGVDLRAAYGQEVRAAAAGVVRFAGDKGGYGTTVIVDHGNGLETRYAHLSAADVQEGSRVDAGDVIARSGSSGRSTGPHLHFEVRQDGRRTDPRAVIGPGDSGRGGPSGVGLQGRSGSSGDGLPGRGGSSDPPKDLGVVADFMK